MDIPNFSSEREARDFLINFFEEFLDRIEKAPTIEEKIKLFKELNLSSLGLEEQILNGKPIKDNPDYQLTKSLLLDFLNWLENEKKINIFEASNQDVFYNNMYGERTLLIAKIIQLLHSFEGDLKIYLILNIYRTTYELNFKNMCFFISSSREKRQVNKSDFYSFENFKNEFEGYPKIHDLLTYFKNDIRNSISHEDWFFKNGGLHLKNNNVEIERNLEDVTNQIYNLFYFRVALTNYLLDKFNNFMKSKELNEEIINKTLQGIKLKIYELKNG